MTDGRLKSNDFWLSSVYSDGSINFVSNPTPKKGEKIEWDDFTFEISRLDKYRVDKIICTKKEEEPEPELED